MTAIQNDDRWRFCGAYGGARNSSVERWECLVCGLKCSHEALPPAGIHPDAMCPLGITPPKEECNDETPI